MSTVSLPPIWKSTLKTLVFVTLLFSPSHAAQSGPSPVIDGAPLKFYAEGALFHDVERSSRAMLLRGGGLRFRNGLKGSSRHFYMVAVVLGTEYSADLVVETEVVVPLRNGKSYCIRTPFMVRDLRKFESRHLLAQVSVPQSVSRELEDESYPGRVRVVSCARPVPVLVDAFSGQPKCRVEHAESGTSVSVSLVQEKFLTDWWGEEIPASRESGVYALLAISPISDSGEVMQLSTSFSVKPRLGNYQSGGRVFDIFLGEVGVSLVYLGHVRTDNDGGRTPDVYSSPADLSPMRVEIRNPIEAEPAAAVHDLTVSLIQPTKMGIW